MSQRKHPACGQCDTRLDGPGNQRYCSEACMVDARNDRRRRKGLTPEQYEELLAQRASEREVRAERRRQKARERQRERYHADPARREYLTAWNKDNAAKRREWGRKARRDLRLKALDAYGGRCACCGERRYEFMAIDHVDGGGSAHRKSLREQGVGPEGFLRWLERSGYPQGFRLLCHNCNSAYGYYGECPHQDTEAENLTRRSA